MENSENKLILAVTGASGSIYALRLLEKLISMKTSAPEIALIFSETAKEIWKYEIGDPYVPKHPVKEFSNDDFFVPFASGSSGYRTMIICPASMGITGRIANGVSDDVITRAADVMLKERGKLILVPRETPYNLIHIRNMETLTLAGAIVCPATPHFYSKPLTIDDLVMTVINRVVSLAGLDPGSYRWMEHD